MFNRCRTLFLEEKREMKTTAVVSEWGRGEGPEGEGGGGGVRRREHTLNLCCEICYKVTCHNVSPDAGNLSGPDCGDYRA